MKKVITLAVLATLSLPAMAVPNSTRWVIETSKDDFTDVVTVNSAIAYSDSSKGMAYMFCSSTGEPTIAVTNGAYSSESAFYSAMYRVDSNAPSTVEIMKTDNKRNHYIQHSSDWVAAFKAGTTAIVKTEGWRGETKVKRFNLTGFTAAYDAVSKACK